MVSTDKRQQSFSVSVIQNAPEMLLLQNREPSGIVKIKTIPCNGKAKPVFSSLHLNMFNICLSNMFSS